MTELFQSQWKLFVFELTDAIMLGNTQKAMETLADLKTVKENVFTLIYLMLSTFEKMLRVKLMNGAPQAEVASEIGVHCSLQENI